LITGLQWIIETGSEDCILLSGICSRKRLTYKPDFSFFISAPTGKSVGSNFVTLSEPMGLPVGARIINGKY
jgi:hypothetical protein